MKTIFDHLEHVKGKPHHVRKRVAFGVAAGGTALVALVWLTSSLSTGTFAIHATSFAESARQTPAIVTSDAAGSGNRNLAGAAAALPAGEQGAAGAAAPAHIEIVDTASSTPSAKQAEATTIPF